MSRLTFSRDPRDRFHDECALFAYCAAEAVPRGERVADLIYYGLYAQQHRGQEGSGIVVTDGVKTRIHKGLGLVSDIFSEEARGLLQGTRGIGHNRYATTGHATKLRNVQPFLVDYKGGKLAVAHNGNLTNVRQLRARMESEGSIFQTTSDTEILLHLIARSSAPDLPSRFAEAAAQVEGALSCIVMDEARILGYRDPRGFRPLSIGKLEENYLLASETCAFDILGAQHLRDVEPGELVLLTPGKLESRRLSDPPRRAACMFEQVYFARPDSVVFGEAVNRVRTEMGRRLARRHPCDADLVIAIPDSSNSAAQGFALELGLPFELGLIRNHYVGRTFIRPGQESRVSAVRVKFNPVRSILEGKRVVAVDDSIVRGTTSRKLVELLFRAGATQVHFRVSSPPVTHPCHYGIDTPTREELIASRAELEAIRAFIGATSLGYLTLEDLAAAVREPDGYCTACWTGRYPTAVPTSGGSTPFDHE